MRFQIGYPICSEEFGVWGTVGLQRSCRHACGVPIRFQAIDQLNFFWTHYFDSCATTTLWVGAPYSNSLRYHHRTAGNFIAGFSLRAPLTDCLFIDGHGAYMSERHASGRIQSRNYAANVCIGITYLIGNEGKFASYLTIANNSNFLIDTSMNQ